MKQIDYRSHINYRESDHKPVTSLFKLNTAARAPDDGPDAVTAVENLVYVTFLPVNNCRVGREDVLFYYSFSDAGLAGRADRSWDWIGLYRDDFTGLDECISYVWAEQEPAALDAQDEGDGVGGIHRAAVFPFVLTPGRFRLLYISGELSSSVLGISNAFEVTC